MRGALRENASWAVAAGVCAAFAGWLTLSSYTWNDYESEALPAVRALIAGHLHDFLRLAPVYGGSLVERAPLALLPGLWGGGGLAVYRMLALPSLLALAALAVWLLSRMHARGASPVIRAGVLLLCFANPVALQALELGHSEELLCGCLCVAAVMLAAGADRRGLAVLSGVALGLAVADKDWAILAAAPVLLAMPPARRKAGAIAAFLAAALPLAPLLLGSSGAFVQGTASVGNSRSPIFQPFQVWWFLGHHGAVRGTSGVLKPGYRLGPAWIEAHSHLVVLLAGLAVSVLLWVWMRRHGVARLAESRALGALALLLLLRCMLDTWDYAYYSAPFLLALLARDTAPEDAPRAPLLAALATIVVWLEFEWLPGRASPDLQAAFYLAWSLSLAALLARGVFGRRASRGFGAASGPGCAGALGRGAQAGTLASPLAHRISR